MHGSPTVTEPGPGLVLSVRRVRSERLVGMGTAVTFRGAADRSRPPRVQLPCSTGAPSAVRGFDSPGGTFDPERMIPSLRDDRPCIHP